MPDLSLARKVLKTEAAAVLALAARLDAHFETAVEMLRTCRGRVIVMGMGKSGIICRKIAATLTSTGTASFFLHPAEAVHGDLGAIMSEDVVIALSYSGETEELLRVLETIKRLGTGLIALTGNPKSTLGTAATVTLDCNVSEEACPMNLVPTASTTAMLAMGDALAMTLSAAKGFSADDLAVRHPGGRIGKRLMRVEQLMTTGHDVPRVELSTVMRDVIYEMSRKGLGMTCVTEPNGTLLGIITDGDLRRKMAASAKGENVLDLHASDAMTPNPVTIVRTTMAAEALHILERRKITSIVVVDEARKVEGVVHLHDLWRTDLV
jgi:arabinose-5-phosphate isomerase